MSMWVLCCNHCNGLLLHKQTTKYPAHEVPNFSLHKLPQYVIFFSNYIVFLVRTAVLESRYLFLFFSAQIPHAHANFHCGMMCIIPRCRPFHTHCRVSDELRFLKILSVTSHGTLLSRARGH